MQPLFVKQEVIDMKRTKKGQALVETIIVLAIYLFMLSFIISGFQLMYNRTILNIAAYQATRTTLAYESATKFATDISSTVYKNFQNNNFSTKSSTKIGEHVGQVIIEENFFGYDTKNYVQDLTFEFYGIPANEVEKTPKENCNADFDGSKHMYLQTVVSCKMYYLFPIIAASGDGIIADSANISCSYTMAKERVYL